jgi:hypothetical protein
LKLLFILEVGEREGMGVVMMGDGMEVKVDVYVGLGLRLVRELKGPLAT